MKERKKKKKPDITCREAGHKKAWGVGADVLIFMLIKLTNKKDAGELFFVR